MRGAAPDEVTVGEGRIHRLADPAKGEAYTEILARHGLEELSADGRSIPPQAEELGMALSGAFGAKFVEVRVDRELGLLRVARVVSAIDGGRILNEKTAASQIIGGTIGGIGQAMFEETASDRGTGRIANATFGDYLIPVNADAPDMDVLFVGEPDRATPVGVKGVGEVGLVGVAPGDRQRRPPRHRAPSAVPADHHRPAPVSRRRAAHPGGPPTRCGHGAPHPETLRPERFRDR